jgi:protein SCO1/2
MRGWTLAGVALALTFLAPAWAQQYSADKPMGAMAQSTPAFLKKANINQNLSQQLPLNDRFVDSSGTEAPLATYFSSGLSLWRWFITNAACFAHRF